MRASHRLYSSVEFLIGRSLAWRLGRWLYLGSRRELVTDPRFNGEHRLQSDVIGALRKLQKARPLVFMDVGANLGDWCQRLIDTMGKGTPCPFVVHAFEPAPGQRERLAARLQGDVAKGRVFVDSRGVADRPGRASFIVTGEVTGNSSLRSTPDHRDAGRTIEVEIATLDEVCTEASYDSIDFVKVDTEGNDFNVILGARSLFDRESIGVLQFEYNQCWIAFEKRLLDVFEFFKGRPYFVGRLTNEGVEVYEHWHYELERYIETNYVIVHRELLPMIHHRMMEFDPSNTAAGRQALLRV